MGGSVYVARLGRFMETWPLCLPWLPPNLDTDGIKGSWENMGSSILGRESWPAGVQWRLRTPSLLPEMVSDFDSLHKPVTLDESQPGSSGCGELEDASRARHWGCLGLLPALVSENQSGVPEAPVGRLVSAFLRRGKLPTTMKDAIVHLLLKLKKNFFPSIAKNFSSWCPVV